MCKVASDKSKTVTKIPLACADETAAVEFLESLRWDDEACCPRCGDCDVYQMTKRGTGERNDRYLWRCRGCGKQFTVRVGTVMEDSPIPLRHWVFAFWAATASKKGVSALQIKRQTGVTYKSALFMMHRIRWAMGARSGRPLDGDVEVDETYVGGKPRYPSKGTAAYRRTTGRSTKPGPAKDFKDRKTQVVAMVERDGEVRTRVRTDVTGENLKAIIRQEVARSARILTDEYIGYRGLGDEFAGHETVTHSEREYARGDVWTNTVESFFALLKRGVIGTFHNVSRKHLHRYASEFEFRWNTRKMDDGQRLGALIRRADGRRLTYADQTR
jgi:transposase-like protein